MQVTVNGKTVDIKRAYNGAVGCMCGCRGDWIDDEPANARRIKLLTGKVLRDPGMRYDDAAKCYYIESKTRTTAVYIE